MPKRDGKAKVRSAKQPKQDEAEVRDLDVKPESDDVRGGRKAGGTQEEYLIVTPPKK